jgi:hypothetical protein
VEQVKAVLDGTWKTHFKKGEATIFTVFTGPLKDNTGQERMPAGQAMTAEQLLSMDWLVEGVVGTIPK